MDWLDTCSQIWGTVCQHVGYIRELDDNVTTLMKETGKLKRKRDEVEDEVNAAESVGNKRRRDVDDWLQDADEIVAEVDSIQSEFDRGKTNVLSRHKLGKRVVEKIEVVKALQDKGVFDEVARNPRRPLMTELQVPSQLEQQSTSQETLQEIEQALSDEEIGVVCVSGMGGIGKTTLMQKIYNRLLKIRDFYLVLWVTVSKDLDLNVIQQKIGNKLGVKFGENDGIEEKRDKLYTRLSNVRYMLILDDLWQKFSLDLIGIPQPNKENRCKIAITTRSVEVGNGMEADRVIRVKTLSSAEAWELFCSKTGDVFLLPEIQSLAREVVRECGGLPLAIKTVGGVMRRKGQKELWLNALRALREPAAPEVPGMEREVFLPLKLSYDFLEDPKIQSCFLYCSLYPEDYEIDTGDLVRYWAFEEGLISNVSSLDDALNKGHGIIDRLKDACLLEEGPQGDGYVRMHDLLRDLATWITSPSSSSSFFLVKAGEGLVQPPEEKTWEGMKRISLMRNQITELQMTTNCPDLVYLSLYKNLRLHTIHNSFFQLMPKLQILDLRDTKIESLPPSLSQLVNLRVLDARDCGYLQDVPPLGHLKELQFLDLGDTGIKSLPQGIANLAKLRSLELSGTEAPATIPHDIISGLTSMEDLGLYNDEQMMSMEIWREVATLPRLTNLRIVLPSLDAFSANDMTHPMWSRLSRFLVRFGRIDWGSSSWKIARSIVISNCEKFPIQINGLMEKAEQLYIQQESLKAGENNALDRRDKPSLQKAIDGGPPKGFQQLRNIYIYGCHKLRCILSSSMLQHLQSLERLTVSHCEEIVEIVEGGPLPDTALLRLSYMELRTLPKLITICSQQLVLTYMKDIWMQNCPELKKLPVLCSGIQEIRGIIEGAREWWEGIEWEDEHSKSLYSTIYKDTEESLQGDDVEEASETEDDEEASEPEPAKEAEAASEL